jgi:hypothetical protein
MKINNDIVEAALNAWFLPDEPQPYNEHYDEHIEAMTKALEAAFGLITKYINEEPTQSVDKE